MARGWESKAIEAQQEMAEERKRPHAIIPREQQAQEGQLRHLELNLQRTVEQLKATNHPRRKQQLIAAQAYLEQQISAIKGGRGTPGGPPAP